MVPQAPTMMLLIGMNINFTKKPMKPITTIPIAVLNAIFVNSKGQEAENVVTVCTELVYIMKVEQILPFLSGF